MIIAALCFYLFAAIIMAASVMVVTSRNPVHAVLYLILAFLNAAGLFVLLGAEFLAMILVIVYVGAVAVLFLFVVMMLNIDLVRMREGFLQYLPVGGLIGLVLLVELGLMVTAWTAEPTGMVLSLPSPGEITNTQALGDLLFTKYFYLFQAAGLVLLVAMIGAIVLTLRTRPDVRRQKIVDQVGRTRAQAIEIKKVTTGSGI